MAASKNIINQRMNQKTNSYLAEAIFIAKKNNLIEIARALSISTRKQSKINLTKINEAKKDTVIIPGKVLSSGEINKKLKVYALGFSEKAKVKLKKAGCEFKNILDVLKQNKKIEGEIIKWKQIKMKIKLY